MANAAPTKRTPEHVSWDDFLTVTKELLYVRKHHAGMVAENFSLLEELAGLYQDHEATVEELKAVTRANRRLRKKLHSSRAECRELTASVADLQTTREVLSQTLKNAVRRLEALRRASGETPQALSQTN